MRPVARCRLLGPVELTVGGAAAAPELLWRKNLALLVVLARAPGRKRTRDQLMLLLWGDKPDSAARHSLNEALRTLRRHLGNEALVTRGEDVRLEPAAVALDTDELVRLLAQNDALAAAELVRGEFMDGFAVPDAWDFEEWLAAERHTWHQRAVHALAEAATQALARGSTQRARDLAERALSLDPLSESAVRPLMLAHALAGDRPTALDAFRRFADALRSAYGIAPGAETETLAVRISAERVWDLPAPSAGVESDATRSWPLVGRAAELETLLGLWEACRADEHTRLGAILGDPGMGKTRLAEEVLTRARLAGAFTATTRAVPGDEASRWRGLAGLLTPGVAGAADVRETPLDPVRHLLGVVAPPDAPIALFVDDAHWLDGESLHLLRALLRDPADRSILLLLTVGPDSTQELDTLLARVDRDVEGAIVRVGPLDTEGVRELVHDALPHLRGVEHDRIVRRIVADSAGVPFLANALLRAITVGLDLHDHAISWPAPFRTLDHTLPAQLPGAVTAAIRVDFRRLGTGARLVLCAAALSDEPVRPEPIARATGLADADLARALDELEWGRWLTSDSRGYTFTARLLRKVVAEEMMTSGQRRRFLAALAQPDSPVA